MVKGLCFFQKVSEVNWNVCATYSRTDMHVDVGSPGVGRSDVVVGWFAGGLVRGGGVKSTLISMLDERPALR